MAKRTVRDLDLLEVSIIDDKKYPAYIGTSIEMRDDEVKIAEYRNADFSKIEIRDEPEQQPEKEVEKIDYQVHIGELTTHLLKGVFLNEIV